MPRQGLLAVSLGTGLLLATPAFAANGETTGPTMMYGGPGFDYEVVIDVPAGTRLINHGCVNVEEWCWVRWGKFRGWIAGEFLLQVHSRGPLLVAVYPPPPPSDDFDGFEEDIIYGGAGYVPNLDDKEFKKFRKSRHGFDRRKRRMRHADFRDSRKFLRLKPRKFLKVKPRRFLRVKPRGFLKIGR